MIKVDIHSDIANKQQGVFLSMLGINDSVFSVDTVKQVFEANPDEKDFMFNIHCNGGSVSEGLAIYDILRSSGRNLYMNIEGDCHSMAVTLLLAAPKENRSANPNARALIHQVYASGGNMNIDQINQLQQEVSREQNAILDIYADRTGTDRATLENLMKEEKTRTAEELLQYGFINKINHYTTNLKQPTMSKQILNKVSSLLNKAGALLNDASLTNYDFTDTDGNILFSTDGTDDTLSVGMTVMIPDGTTEGTFTLADGRTVTVKDGAITDVQEAPADPAPAPDGANQSERVAALENALRDSADLIKDMRAEMTNLKSQIQSNYQAPTRTTNAKAPITNQKTKDDWKNEMREKTNKK